MATHTAHGAMTQMYLDAEGFPWTSPVWQEITGVRHGLFPPDDALLPQGSGWTREKANYVASYFDQFDKKATEEEKISFSIGRKNANQVPGEEKISFSIGRKNANQAPGRLIWRNFITEGFKTWKIHAKITAVLTEEGIHPLSIIQNSKTGSIEDWPLSADYVPLALTAVGLCLFGEEAITPAGHLEDRLRRTTRALIHRTWCNIRNQVWRSRNRIATFEEEATNAFDSVYTYFLISF